jgi:cysteine desulfurase / selenocysteine lyase
MNMLYLDNAATSFPKPETMLQAMILYQKLIGGSPGRSGHSLSINAGRIVFETREALASLFNIDDPLRIAFTNNATEALNIALCGLLQKGDHVITTGMEHNSVMRPLRFLVAQGVELSIVPCSTEGVLDPDDVRKTIRPSTKMIVLTHASNVTGTIMPVEEIGAISRQRSILLCVDAAQTAGTLTIDVEKMSIDLLAFSGHKSLCGPQGTGGLFVRQGLDKKIQPLMRGGTGSRSEFEEQPDFMPDKYESGTPNTIGIAGLKAGVSFVMKQTMEAIRQKKATLTQRFIDHLREMRDDVILYGPQDSSKQTAVVSFNLKNIISSDAASYFEEKWGIMCRAGLHCAPAVHKAIGSFPQGAVRFSFGLFNTEQDIDLAAEAVRQILRR